MDASGYTLLLDSLSLVELYNPGWQNAPERDINVTISGFLGEHDYVIVDPRSVIRAEIQAYPNVLSQLPVEFASNSISSFNRGEVLLRFLRRDKMFLVQGKDVGDWATNYHAGKRTWLADAQHILDDAFIKGTLVKGRNGKPERLLDCKEEFLKALDMRHFGHFTANERENLGTKIVNLYMGGTAQLPATRFTSLCYWYAYVETDPAYPMKRQPSDLGDFYQMSLLPYCAAFTLDTTMARLARRILVHEPYPCKVLDPVELKRQLNYP